MSKSDLAAFPDEAKAQEELLAIAELHSEGSLPVHGTAVPVKDLDGRCRSGTGAARRHHRWPARHPDGPCA